MSIHHHCRACDGMLSGNDPRLSIQRIGLDAPPHDIYAHDRLPRPSTSDMTYARHRFLYGHFLCVAFLGLVAVVHFFFFRVCRCAPPPFPPPPLRKKRGERREKKKLFRLLQHDSSTHKTTQNKTIYFFLSSVKPNRRPLLLFSLFPSVTQRTNADRLVAKKTDTPA